MNRDPEKVRVVKDRPVPTSVKQLKAFWALLISSNVLFAITAASLLP